MASPNFSLTKKATEYCINLDDLVDRNPTPSFRGGNALVYQGTLRPMGVLVAVKDVQSAFLVDPETIETILGEVEVWSLLNHENIVQFFGITTKFGSVSMVSKWMAAGNAHQYVQDPTIDPRPLMAGIARGMCYLHTHSTGPIVHGDLKGSNVLISDEGHALITDFGYTCYLNSSNTIGFPKGTPGWMAPEIAKSIGLGRQCKISTEGDVWAYGMTCLELFTRQVPFHDLKTLFHITDRIIKGPPNRPNNDTTYFRMSDEWWGICSWCCTPDPALEPVR